MENLNTKPKECNDSNLTDPYLKCTLKTTTVADKMLYKLKQINKNKDIKNTLEKYIKTVKTSKH